MEETRRETADKMDAALAPSDKYLSGKKSVINL